METNKELVFGVDKATEISIIEYMSKITGVKYSEEQLNILKTHGGMCILASAGSGKTTTLNHLIAKRIQTGEISDPNKLLCTTFSKAGADEMGQRLSQLLSQLGIRKTVTVRTLHSIYFSLLKDMQYKLNLVDNGAKISYIRDACKEYNIQLEDDEIQTLDSILSYQVNNLMSDTDVFQSYIYTLRDKIPSDIYSAIRSSFNRKKQEAGVIDFDDMQLMVYQIFRSETYGEPLRRYCNSLWEYIYIDEAQDISKIQFAILKKLVSDPNKLVIIGDDDQCLVAGTKILVDSTELNSEIPIELVKSGDSVASCCGSTTPEFRRVDNTSKKKVNTEVVTIKTESGKSITGTNNHIGFASLYNSKNSSLNDLDSNTCEISFTILGDYYSHENGGSKCRLVIDTKNSEHISIIKNHIKISSKALILSDNIDYIDKLVNDIEADFRSKNISISITRNAQIGDLKYDFIYLGQIKEGMFIPVIHNNKIVADRVVSVIKSKYDGFVYDISVPSTRNFIANDIVVHNCIYQWRGADPSIILNICGIYPELTRVTLTTNYRCLSNIVDRASHGIKFNAVRSDKKMVAYDNGGTIRFCNTGDCNFYDMSKYAYKYITQLIFDEGVLPSDIAVLSRNNQHLTILGNMLFKSGIFCKQADEIKFTKANIYKIINSAFKLGENTTNGNITGDNIWKYCSYMSRKISKEIGKIQVAYGLSLCDNLGLILTEFCKIDVGWQNPGVRVGSLDFSKYSQMMASISNDTINSIITIYRLLSKNNTAEAVIGLLGLFLNTKISLFYKSQSASKFAEGYIQYIADLIKDMGYNNFSRYLKTVEQFESGKMAVMSPMVTLSTMHGAKGKEWKHVLIFADDNISFPSFENINTCIENGVPEIDIRRMIDEDRRLHYVAITRAKENLVIFADSHNLSLYTLESFGIMDCGKSNDTHIIMMAQQGVYDGLRSEGIKLFDIDSGYGLVIDMKDTDYQKDDTDNNNCYRDDAKCIHDNSINNFEDNKNSSNDTSLNISSIQTFAPLRFDDDDDE